MSTELNRFLIYLNGRYPFYIMDRDVDIWGSEGQSTLVMHVDVLVVIGSFGGWGGV